jgi:hypothetical protein
VRADRIERFTRIAEGVFEELKHPRTRSGEFRGNHVSAFMHNGHSIKLTREGGVMGKVHAYVNAEHIGEFSSANQARKAAKLHADDLAERADPTGGRRVKGATVVPETRPGAGYGVRSPRHPIKPLKTRAARAVPRDQGGYT